MEDDQRGKLAFLAQLKRIYTAGNGLNWPPFTHNALVRFVAVGAIQGEREIGGCVALAHPTCCPERDSGAHGLARDLCRAHFFNTLVTSRAPAIRLGGRTLINASSDPLARQPTPPLLPKGMPSTHTRGVLHAIPAVVGSPIMYEGWVLKKRRKKMQGMEALLPASEVQCIDFSPLGHSKLVRFCPPLLYPLRVRDPILRIWPRRARP